MRSVAVARPLCWLARYLKCSVFFLNTGVLTYVTVWWCPVPRQCGGFSVSTTSGSTAGTEFLLSHVGQSAIVAEYKGHPENDPLVKSMCKEDGELEFFLGPKNCCTDKSVRGLSCCMSQARFRIISGLARSDGARTCRANTG